MHQVADQVIVTKIRKLLRLAKTEGPEGENAAARAAELMEKHQLDVKLEDAHFRLVCENVSGELWREQILLAVALSHGCKLMIGTERAGSEKGCAAVVGERKHAEEAVAHYLRMQVGLVMKCQRDWQRFVDQTIPRTSGHLDHVFRMNEIIGVWSRLYLINAAQTVAARMQATRNTANYGCAAAPKTAASPGGRTGPGPEVVDLPPTPERVAESRQSDEEVTIEREASVLEKLMGIERAMQLQHTAWSCGAIVGGAVSIVDDGSGAMGEERQLR